MEPGATIFRWGVAGLVLLLAVVIGGALVLVPEASRSNAFWFATTWVAVLAGLVWIAVVNYMIQPTTGSSLSKEMGGIAPAIILIAVVYAVFSMVLLLIHYFMPQGAASSRLHLFLQITRAGACGLALVFLYVAKTHAAQGLHPHNRTVKTPEELCSLLAAEESRLSAMTEQAQVARTIDEIKKLRTALRYSLPNVSRISEDASYHELVTAIESILVSLKACGDPASSACEPCSGALASITTKAKTLSNRCIQS
jgi:hypothetical protein